jgi:hypothetical protein
MFGSGFTLGFSLSDVTTQVAGFLGNPVIVGLIAVSLALLIIPRIIQTAKSSLGSASGGRKWLSWIDDEGHTHVGRYSYQLPDDVSVRKDGLEDWSKHDFGLGEDEL